MEQEISERIKAECIGIRCFNEIKEAKEYSLIPIYEWTKEICDELNKTDFAKIYKMNIDQIPEITDEYKDKFSNLEKVKSEYRVENVYEYNKLPDEVSFVRFSKIIILKNKSDIENTDIVSRIESSIIEKLGIVTSFDEIKNSLLNENKPITKESLKSVTDICALSAKFSSNRRPKTGSENHIWYELLQNANDHIPGDSADKEFKIHFDEEAKTFTLEYPDNGFSVRDFLAVCTEGNSGNVLSGENREGHKGTGFKSVYNLFDEVTITSGPVKCVLKDVEKDIEITEYGKIIVTDMENAKRSDYYYPIPEFSYPVEGYEKKTKISFHSNDGLESIKKLVFGSELSSESDALDKFMKQEDYLFLDNIKKFLFIFKGDTSEKTLEFCREDYIQKNYIRKEYDINSENVISMEENPNWKNRSKELFNPKKKLTFLFPKNIQFPEDTVESRVYCTLPINEFKLKVPFYVNIPLLELKDDRKSLADQEMGKFRFKEWNKAVLESGLMKGFKWIVEHDIEADSNNSRESGDNDNIIGLSNWYKYFPYGYLESKKWILDLVWSCDLQKVKFLCATTSTVAGGKRNKAVAVSDLVQSKEDIQNKEKSIFLPCNMYRWLHKNKEDVFESKGSGDDKPVSFIYYDYDIPEEMGWDDAKDYIIEDKIKEKFNVLENNNPFENRSPSKFSYSLSYFQEQEGQVGKILLELKDYLLNDYKKNKTAAFNEWLKELLKSNDFELINKNIVIYQAYFHANDVNYQEGKYHWLKNGEGGFFNTNIGKYESINGIIEKMKNDLYGPQPYTFQMEEDYSIKASFEDLIESPYIKYIYEKSNDIWNTSKELRTYDDILPRNKDDCSISQGDRVWNVDNVDVQEVLCYYTKKLLDQEDPNSNLSMGQVNDLKGWFNINNVALYVKNTNGKIILASETIYFTEKDIKNDSLVNYGEKFFIGLEVSLSKDGDFFDKNIGDEKFVEQILKRYDLSDWKEQAIKFINNSTDAIRFTIFRYLIKKSEEPIEWTDKYSDLVKNFSITELWKDGSVVFSFDKKTINKLPQYVLDIFENKVSSQEKDKTKIGDRELGKSMQEIVRNEIYILPCRTGNKSLYCKGQISDDNAQETREVYVLFGENAFGTLLRREFECNDFSEYKIYDEMLCYDIDELKKQEAQKAEKFSDAIESKVDVLIDKWTGGEQEELKKALVTRFDVKNKETKKWFHARGYGNNDYTERKCPICKGILLSEMNALTVRNITCRIHEQKYYFPTLMCKNCGESINYAETVELGIPECYESDGDIFKVTDNSFIEYDIIFSMNGRKEKKITCDVSFLNRYIWKCIKEKEDANRSV